MSEDNNTSNNLGKLEDTGAGEANAILQQLINSGKVSMDDAKDALNAVKNRSTSLSNKSSPSPPSNSNNNKIKKQKKQKNLVSSQEKYRTRHVALQFSYDGTDFTGFAQNIGKECDNSVEKAVFAALEKTRLLVQPDEHGIQSSNVKMTANNEKHTTDNNINIEKEDNEASARTAAQYSRCGRTDKGVHAHGQVIAIYLKSAFPLTAQLLDGTDGSSNKLLEETMLPKNSIDGLECLVQPKSKKSKASNNDNNQILPLQQKTITEYDYPRILNNILPPSIRILGWCPVSSEFSARFSCSQRTYRYFFPRRNLDLSAMAQGLQYMMGKHDFRNVCKMNCEQVYNFERMLMKGKVVSPQKVYTVSMEEENPSIHSVNDGDTEQTSPHDMCHVEIIGQAFLWHQIRCIMSILFYIGRKLESPSIVQQLFDIETNPAKPSYEMASDSALVLQDCKFSHLTLGRSVHNLWNVTKVFEQRWENHAVAAERARDEIESIKTETEVRWSDVTDFVMNIARDRRRKEKKRANKMITGDEGEIRQALDGLAPETPMISWGAAVKIIEQVLGVYPYPPNGSNQYQKGQTESSIHVPLMNRSKGTTYEEKVQSILVTGEGKSSKRKERYEENIIKKRKTSEEDTAFYKHKLSQGSV